MRKIIVAFIVLWSMIVAGWGGSAQCAEINQAIIHKLFGVLLMVMDVMNYQFLRSFGIYIFMGVQIPSLQLVRHL